jgi:hypothetical protein
MRRLGALLCAAACAAVITAPAGAATYQSYELGAVSAASSYDAFVTKGSASASEVAAARSHGTFVVNYEEAFALNDREAAYARSRGWLARTCSGAEIHPANIASKTLLDVTKPEAIKWRAERISSETNALGYQASFIDTLRAYTPNGFYDGSPCNWTDGDWLSASVRLVDTVQALTGKPVIENGAGLGSGSKFFANRPATETLLKAGDGAQIEHFCRKADKCSVDQKFLSYIVSLGKYALAKCQGDPSLCQQSYVSSPGAFMRL